MLTMCDPSVIFKRERIRSWFAMLYLMCNSSYEFSTPYLVTILDSKRKILHFITKNRKIVKISYSSDNF